MTKNDIKETLINPKNEIKPKMDSNKEINDIHKQYQDLADSQSDKENFYVLPESSPVKPLGRYDNLYYYSNTMGGISALSADKHSNLNMLGMYAPNTKWLYDNFPVWKKTKEGYEENPKKYDISSAANCLITSCANKGLWNPQNKQREEGAFKHNDKIVINQGDNIIELEKNGKFAIKETGLHDGFFYIKREPHLPPIIPGEKQDMNWNIFGILQEICQILTHG